MAYNALAWHLDQCLCIPVYVDKFKVFYQTSGCSPVALEANMIFDVHLDE
jgi:hypothetical protein